jgi:hypothetical protein
MRKDAKDSEEPPGPRGHVTFATRTIGYSGVLPGHPGSRTGWSCTWSCWCRLILSGDPPIEVSDTGR